MLMVPKCALEIRCRSVDWPELCAGEVHCPTKVTLNTIIISHSAHCSSLKTSRGRGSEVIPAVTSCDHSWSLCRHFAVPRIQSFNAQAPLYCATHQRTERQQSSDNHHAAVTQSRVNCHIFQAVQA